MYVKSSCASPVPTFPSKAGADAKADDLPLHFDHSILSAYKHITATTCGMIPDVEKNSLLPVFIAISMHPRANHTRRIAADHFHGVSRVLWVDEFPGVAATP